MGELAFRFRIAGKFGEELNLAVWRLALQPPIKKSANISLYAYDDAVLYCQIYIHQ